MFQTVLLHDKKKQMLVPQKHTEMLRNDQEAVCENNRCRRCTFLSEIRRSKTTYYINPAAIIEFLYLVRPFVLTSKDVIGL